MSATNAPQPDSSGPAEVFDSTIAPSDGPSPSSIGGPGPNNLEAPQHTGNMNGIDPYFYSQYIIISTVTWSTHQNAGTNIFTLPIHPSIHPWLGHLSKMYNTWVGGLDVAVKVAGTGFHAGGLMVLRTPPNINPTKINTPTAASAFEYRIIDPKTLQVEIQSVIDQRNIMYHYLPIDLLDRTTFGGYIALNVAIPLNTSSTGATQIDVQIYVRPSRNFMFSQIIPIDVAISNIVDPNDIKKAINFKDGYKHSLTRNELIRKLIVWTRKTKIELTFEAVNGIKFNKDPTQGYFVPPLNNLQFIKVKNLVSKHFQYTNYEPPSNKMGMIYFSEGQSVIAFDFDDTPSFRMPIVLGTARLHINFQNSDLNMPVVLDGGFYKVNPTTDPIEYKDRQVKFIISNHTHNDTSNFFIYGLAENFFEKVDDNTEIFPHFVKYITEVAIEFTQESRFDFQYTPYAPPIAESLITFISDTSESSMTLELRDELNAGSYGGFMDSKDVLIFELIDTNVDLPLLPVKLHYNGYFTTIEHLTDTHFNLDDQRFYFKFLGRSSAADPLSGSKIVKTTLTQYAKNNAVSRMFSSRLNF